MINVVYSSTIPSLVVVWCTDGERTVGWDRIWPLPHVIRSSPPPRPPCAFWILQNSAASQPRQPHPPANPGGLLFSFFSSSSVSYCTDRNSLAECFRLSAQFVASFCVHNNNVCWILKKTWYGSPFFFCMYPLCRMPHRMPRQADAHEGPNGTNWQRDASTRVT